MGVSGLWLRTRSAENLTTRGEGGLLVLGARLHPASPACTVSSLDMACGGRGPAGTTTRRGPGSPRRAPERRVPVSGVTYHRRSTTCTCRSTLAAAPLVLALLTWFHFDFDPQFLSARSPSGVVGSSLVRQLLYSFSFLTKTKMAPSSVTLKLVMYARVLFRSVGIFSEATTGS